MGVHMMFDEDRDNGRMPKFKSYFQVSGMPYELNQSQVASVVSELLSHGAGGVTITRVIADENFTPQPEPVQEVEVHGLDNGASGIQPLFPDTFGMGVVDDAP